MWRVGSGGSLTLWAIDTLSKVYRTAYGFTVRRSVSVWHYFKCGVKRLFIFKTHSPHRGRGSAVGEIDKVYHCA